MIIYMLNIYFIHGKCVDIMLSHDLKLKVQFDFIYVTKGFCNYKVDCNYFLITNYNMKIKLFFITNVMNFLYLIKMFN
jgi:hypothetical protein